MTSDMSLRIKVGQRLAAGFPGHEMTDEFIAVVRERKVGNVILFDSNVLDNGQLHRLCAEIQALVTRETGHSAFITIDQEGGVVTRLKNDAAIAPSAMAVASTGDPENAYRAGYITGRELNAIGVNFDLAPDMDINSNPQNPVIGSRSYGDTPETVTEYSLRMARGLLDGGVLCAGKHFPGHGDTAVDSHLGLPVVDRTLDELISRELAPFRAAIEAGVPAIMTTHILFPKLEPDRLPATMSRRIITGLLRERLGFDGLVISDCMMMGAISDFYGTVNGCLSAVKAGVDIVFTSHSAALAGEACERIERAVLSGEYPLCELDASVSRILRYKDMAGAMPRAEFSGAFLESGRREMQSMMESALCLAKGPTATLPPLGGSPVFLGCHPFQPTLASSPENKAVSFPDYMAERLGGTAIRTPVDPRDADISEAAAASRGHSCIVLGTYNGHIKRGQLKLAEALCGLSAPLICIALRNPYDLSYIPEGAWGVAAFQYDVRSLAAVARALSGEIKPSGRLSVKI